MGLSREDQGASPRGKTGCCMEQPQECIHIEALPAPQPSTRKPVRDGNEKKNPKAYTSKNVHRVEEQVMENPEFLDDLALNSDDNANADAAEGQPMGTGITSRFN